MRILRRGSRIRTNKSTILIREIQIRHDKRALQEYQVWVVFESRNSKGEIIRMGLDLDGFIYLIGGTR